MKKASLLACCLFLFPLIGTPPYVPKSRLTSLTRPEDRMEPSPNLRSRLRDSGALYAAGRYHDAATTFGTLAADALSAHDFDIAARATGNLGGCFFAPHQYQAALNAFLRARQLAESIGDRSETPVLDANISSLYSEMGEFDASAKWLEDTTLSGCGSAAGKCCRVPD